MPSDEAVFLSGYIAAALYDKNLPLRVSKRDMNEEDFSITLTLGSGKILYIRVADIGGADAKPR